MDNLLYSIKKEKEYKRTFLNKKEMKEIIEKNSLNLFNCNIIISDFYINKDNNDYIDTLLIDENLRLVIIEYRVGKNSRIIQNGLMHIDYIKSHISIFKMLINDNLERLNINKSDVNKIDYNARLVVIGEAFHRFDGDSITKISYDIELINLNYFNKDYILLNKTYVSRNINMNNFKLKLNKDELEILSYLNDFILTLGEEINIYGMNNIITYRKIKTFMYLIFNDGIKLIIDNKIKNINSIKDITKLEKEIENCYDKR